MTANGKEMRVHLHTVCWNDRPMLDFFFRHYDAWVDHYFIHDDGSTDGSRELLEARPDVTVETLVRTHPDSWVLSAKHIYDNSWKRSRGEADWVVIPNIDEHLYHPDMRGYLARCLDERVCAIPALGYQMISETWPEEDALLWRDYPYGAPWWLMSKMQMFCPALVEEIDFGPGRHTASYKGEGSLPSEDEVLNLHYKYLGYEYAKARHDELATGLGPMDVEQSWGRQYSWKKSRLKADLRSVFERRVDVHEAAKGGHAAHADIRWWRQTPEPACQP